MIKLGNIKKIIAASITALVLWTLISVNTDAFKTEEEFEYFNYILSYVLSAAAWFVIALDFNLDERFKKGTAIGLFAITPFVCMHISMLLAGEPEFGLGIYFMNVFFFTAVMAAVFAVTRSFRWSAAVTAVLSYAFCMATFIVNMLRGIPLIPNDFLAINTAATVAENYTFEWEFPMVVSTVVLVFFVTLLFKFSYKPKFRYKNLIFSSSGAIAAVVLAVVFSGIDYSDVSMDIFDQYHANNTHGIVFSFFLNAKAMKIETPQNYDAESVEERLNQTETDYTVSGKKPNIVVIMNESFADLGVLGDLETNKEYMPYFNSLKKNTVKGELLVSPFGGYTCNTEFEFLTGLSMGLLPSGAAPYLQYIQSDYPYALPAYLSKLGYTTTAVHPYYGRCWNRDKVYGLLGFDTFINLDNMDKYQNKDEFQYIRNYMSDRTSYSAVLNQLINKKPGESAFIFNVTMQNHGGYSGYDPSLTDIEITNLEGVYKETEQYLNLIKESDTALEELLSYLKNWDEPVMVMMFGDHQPAVEQEFFEEMLGTPLSRLSAEEMLQRYRVPFMLWANFDMESEDGILTSPNYLSNILLEKAGLPKSKINVFLDEARGQFPQINAMGHYNNDGVWGSNDENNSELLDEYRSLEYYMLKENDKNIEE